MEMIATLVHFFLTMLYISLIAFGGSAQPLFEQFTVLQNHWLSQTDFAAVLAFGYSTPGPAVFGTAAFIGYRLAGLPGAVVGSVGIFTVPLLASLITAKYLTTILEKPSAKAFIRGVGLAASGLLAATALHIAGPNWLHPANFAIMLLAYILLTRKLSNPLLLLVGGGLVTTIFGI